MRDLGAFRGRTGILFDLDGTLYCNAGNSAFIAEVDRITGLRVRASYGVDDPHEAFRLLVRDQAAHGHRSKSEALERLFGVGLAEMNRWRERHTEPGRFLAPDPRLLAVLETLAERFELVLGTNNAPGLCRRILAVLGLPEGLFRAILTSEDVGAAKPEAAFFEAVCAVVETPPARLVSVGDRPASDVEPAAALGMGTFLVRRIQDVYDLAGAEP